MLPHPGLVFKRHFQLFKTADLNTSIKEDTFHMYCENSLAEITLQSNFFTEAFFPFKMSKHDWCIDYFQDWPLKLYPYFT